MAELLIGNDTAVITMLLLFIAGLLTKRFVPWWVHEEALKKLKEYEEAAPEIISEVRRLLDALDEQEAGGETKAEDLKKSSRLTPRLRQRAISLERN